MEVVCYVRVEHWELGLLNARSVGVIPMLEKPQGVRCIVSLIQPYQQALLTNTTITCIMITPSSSPQQHYPIVAQMNPISPTPHQSPSLLETTTLSPSPSKDTPSPPHQS